MTKTEKYWVLRSTTVMFFFINFYLLVFKHTYRRMCTPLLLNCVVFFCDLCMRTIRISDLDRLETDIIIILCKWKEYFHVFSSVMVHLANHLPYEAKVTGLVNYSWMYLIERSLHMLKQYVQNKARSEGSICRSIYDE